MNSLVHLTSVSGTDGEKFVLFKLVKRQIDFIHFEILHSFHLFLPSVSKTCAVTAGDWKFGLHMRKQCNELCIAGVSGHEEIA